MNVDNKILRGGTHAIRHRAILGFTWFTLHLAYHICLVLLATGLGILVRDVIVNPTTKTASLLRVAVRAATPAAGKSTGAYFTSGPRWLFSGGWSGSLLLSAALSGTHRASPHETTKYARLVVRVALAIALGVGMPLSGVSAGGYLLLHAITTAVIAIVEYILVQADAINIFGRRRAQAVMTDGAIEDSFDSDDSDDDDWKPNTENDAPASADPEAQLERMRECRAKQALRGRLNLRSCHRMERVDASDTRRYKECSILDLS